MSNCQTTLEADTRQQRARQLQKLAEDLQQERAWVGQMTLDLRLKRRVLDLRLVERSIQTMCENHCHFENRLIALGSEPEASLQLWQLIGDLETRIYALQSSEQF
ncbi:MAG: hypothetical protein ACAI44_11980 [Candidatus Sericytochromatia bacterium]